MPLKKETSKFHKEGEIQPNILVFLCALEPLWQKITFSGQTLK
jgi:hypothetical protein